MRSARSCLSHKARRSGIEVEAVAIEKDHGGKVYCTRLVFSPEEGPLKMCSVYLREEGGGGVCIADLPTK